MAGGRRGVVKLFLGREDVNPDTLSTVLDQMSLLRAAGSGHKGIVKLLLAREAVNPNNSGKYSGTPLMLAFPDRRFLIAQLLHTRHSRHMR